jgi:(S)-ureidoglycine aminohydrolase
MFHLGNTRSSNQPDHLLQTPDTFVRAPLPGMRNATAIVHIGPARGAAFTQYTVEFAAGGQYEMGPAQVFIYVLDGRVHIDGRTLSANQYAYLPAGAKAYMATPLPARAVVIERTTTADLPPFDGDESRVAAVPLNGDEALGVRTLFPNDPVYDFAVNTMTYQPGATLPMVEIHVMEHGLLIGDFIWMAPYCPQWFGALGKKPAKYLIYKDWNQHPLHAK